MMGLQNGAKSVVTMRIREATVYTNTQPISMDYQSSMILLGTVNVLEVRLRIEAIRSQISEESRGSKQR